MLEGQDLIRVAGVLMAMARLKKDLQSRDGLLAEEASPMEPLEHVSAEINAMLLPTGEISDDAYPLLRDLRIPLPRHPRSSILEKLEQILEQAQDQVRAHGGAHHQAQRPVRDPGAARLPRPHEGHHPRLFQDQPHGLRGAPGRGGREQHPEPDQVADPRGRAQGAQGAHLPGALSTPAEIREEPARLRQARPAGRLRPRGPSTSGAVDPQDRRGGDRT
ncbi:MAG: hypothetical protein MZU91_02670 [Desulfosudis oleivorans]|nr:hypothetical protein [Desulfosudis oleivorans]